MTAYKIYAQKRPPNFSDQCSPYYLTINGYIKNVKWFNPSPLGLNKLALMMKNLARKAKLDRVNISNHSILRKNGVETKILDYNNKRSNDNALYSYFMATNLNNQQEETSSSLQPGSTSSLESPIPSHDNYITKSSSGNNENDSITQDLSVEVCGGKFSKIKFSRF